jgi:N-acyl homoserine lactone hydrolase
MRILTLALLLFVGLVSGATAGEVDHLYVIDCGWAHLDDQSSLSPGINAGVPIDISDNCYLIHHSTEGYILWDTGITDRLVALPSGIKVPENGETWHRGGTLLSALAALGVKPSDIHYVAISHWHPDHTGNIDEFPDATVIMQKADWDFVTRLPQKPFHQDHKHLLLEGDKDLFGDGSLTAISTPGHTPGHESLLVHLPKTGYVVLSGDVAHIQSNWDNRIVPAENYDKAASLASMEKIAKILKEKHAQLWINHDKPSSDARLHAPQFYE